MKLLIVLTCLLAVTIAQRPWYAGTRPIGYPDLANRFKEDGATQPVNNRFEGPRDKIPIDAREDYDLVHRLNQWPRENRPFWLLNADHIEAHRNTPVRQQWNGNNPQSLPSRFGDSSQQNNINNNNNYPDPYYYYSFGYDDFGNPKFYHY